MGGTTRSNRGSSSTGSEEENLEKLMSKVCNNFLAQFESKLDSRLQKLEDKLTQVCDSIKALTASVEKNSKKIIELDEKIDNLEQDRKKNCIRICGLPENPNENLIESIIHFVRTDLKINCASSEIDYCFRMGAVSEDDGPRTIIANFLCNWKKNEIMGAKTILKGTPFAVFEDLTPKRYKMLEQAKRKYGKNKAWSSGGKVYFWDPKNNKKTLITGDR